MNSTQRCWMFSCYSRPYNVYVSTSTKTQMTWACMQGRSHKYCVLNLQKCYFDTQITLSLNLVSWLPYLLTYYLKISTSTSQKKPELNVWSKKAQNSKLYIYRSIFSMVVYTLKRFFFILCYLQSPLYIKKFM